MSGSPAFPPPPVAYGVDVTPQQVKKISLFNPDFSAREFGCWLREELPPLHEFIIPGVSGALVLACATEQNTPAALAELFPDLPRDNKASLITLRHQMKSYSKMSRDMQTMQAKKQRRKAERAAAAQSWDVAEEVDAQASSKRPWEHIVASSKSNSSKQAKRVDASRREHFEQHGYRTQLSLPCSGGYQRHHNWLLGSGA